MAGNRATMAEIFDLIDSDMSGFISSEEARQFTACLPIEIPTGVLDDMFTRSDLNKDGQVSRGEFGNLAKSIQQYCHINADEMIDLCKRHCYIELFNMVDRDEGGTVSSDELLKLLLLIRTELKLSITDEAVRQVKTELGIGNQGDMDQEEFITVMNRITSGVSVSHILHAFSRALNVVEDQTANAFSVFFKAAGGAAPFLKRRQSQSPVSLGGSFSSANIQRRLAEEADAAEAVLQAEVASPTLQSPTGPAAARTLPPPPVQAAVQAPAAPAQAPPPPRAPAPRAPLAPLLVVTSEDGVEVPGYETEDEDDTASPAHPPRARLPFSAEVTHDEVSALLRPATPLMPTTPVAVVAAEPVVEPQKAEAPAVAVPEERELTVEEEEEAYLTALLENSPMGGEEDDEDVGAAEANIVYDTTPMVGGSRQADTGTVTQAQQTAQEGAVAFCTTPLGLRPAREDLSTQTPDVSPMSPDFTSPGGPCALVHVKPIPSLRGAKAVERVDAWLKRLLSPFGNVTALATAIPQGYSRVLFSSSTEATRAVDAAAQGLLKSYTGRQVLAVRLLSEVGPHAAGEVENVDGEPEAAPADVAPPCASPVSPFRTRAEPPTTVLDVLPITPCTPLYATLHSSPSRRLDLELLATPPPAKSAADARENASTRQQRAAERAARFENPDDAGAGLRMLAAVKPRHAYDEHRGIALLLLSADGVYRTVASGTALEPSYVLPTWFEGGKDPMPPLPLGETKPTPIKPSSRCPLHADDCSPRLTRREPLEDAAAAAAAQPLSPPPFSAAAVAVPPPLQPAESAPPAAVPPPPPPPPQPAGEVGAGEEAPAEPASPGQETAAPSATPAPPVTEVAAGAAAPEPAAAAADGDAPAPEAEPAAGVAVAEAGSAEAGEPQPQPQPQPQEASPVVEEESAVATAAQPPPPPPPPPPPAAEPVRERALREVDVTLQVKTSIIALAKKKQEDREAQRRQMAEMKEASLFVAAPAGGPDAPAIRYKSKRGRKKGPGVDRFALAVQKALPRQNFDAPARSVGDKALQACEREARREVLERPKHPKILAGEPGGQPLTDRQLANLQRLPGPTSAIVESPALALLEDSRYMQTVRAASVPRVPPQHNQRPLSPPPPSAAAPAAASGRGEVLSSGVPFDDCVQRFDPAAPHHRRSASPGGQPQAAAVLPLEPHESLPLEELRKMDKSELLAHLQRKQEAELAMLQYHEARMGEETAPAPAPEEEGATEPLIREHALVGRPSLTDVYKDGGYVYESIPHTNKTVDWARVETMEHEIERQVRDLDARTTPDDLVVQAAYTEGMRPELKAAADLDQMTQVLLHNRLREERREDEMAFLQDEVLRLRERRLRESQQQQQQQQSGGW